MRFGVMTEMLWATQNCGKLKFEKWKNVKLRYWSPKTASILSQGPPRSLRPQKRETIADALPRKPTFRRNFRPRGQSGQKSKFSLLLCGTISFGRGIISQHQIKLFRVFFKRYGAIFCPRNGCFGLKMPILRSHIIHISHSVSWQILL